MMADSDNGVFSQSVNLLQKVLLFCFLADFCTDFWQGFLQVVGHGPDGEYDGYPEKPVAPDVGVDEVEEAVVVEQQGDGCHLDAGFEFAQDVYGYAA